MSEIYNYIQSTRWQYKERNNEYIVKTCPYCQKQDKLYVNCNTGASHCKYAGCQANAGKHITEILSDFNIPFNRQPNLSVSQAYQKKNYSKPADKPNALRPDEIQYLKSRGLSDETIKASGIYHVDRADGYNLAIPFYRHKVKTLVKYRSVYPDPSKGKEIASSNCEQILWNMDNVSPNEPLVISEGMIDALSIIESGYKNVVSLPSGTGSTKCIDNCFDFIDQFNEFILFMDNDTAGHECRAKLLNRLGIDKCRLIQFPDECNDANDILLKHGKERLYSVVKNSYIAPKKGLVAAQLIESNAEMVPTTDSLIYPIKAALNGYEEGALTLWTGDSGCGKSTILYNEMGCALRDGARVCIFSGEMSLTTLKKWVYTPMAGLDNIDIVEQRFRKDYNVKLEIANKLDRIYGPQLTLVDEQHPAVEKLLEQFTYSLKRYNSNIFVIDNLMVMNLHSAKSRDPNQDQTTAVLKLADFCKKYQVHIHLVAHQSKTLQPNSKNKVSGSKNITNTSWNIIEVNRLSWKAKKEMLKELYNDHYEASPENIRNLTPDSVLNVLKNRQYGDEPRDIYLRFFPNSRRIAYFPFGQDNDIDEFQAIYDVYGHKRDMIKPRNEALLEQHINEFQTQNKGLDDDDDAVRKYIEHRKT